MSVRRISTLLMIATVSFAVPGDPASATDSVVLTLKDNSFIPPAISVPAGERLRIHVKNEDKTPAEFESSDLRVEKIVTGGGQISVTIGPLKPGTYKFFDDYHPDTAQGTLTAVKKE